ncbi:YjbH domain-containing protein [Zunongwangia sp. F363]|uniref:YjbH domain-containing protein n=1 Tax=Autumnicola tepida TaxID=3075595 RepID=A0ABU3C7N1_9FLAO|nr:YjbH domain-containing protein [Zunongwangia sp. F363]MDT0642316.1 YjbH domain-containing protein [Zunongwangia sp. F363]
MKTAWSSFLLLMATTSLLGQGIEDRLFKAGFENVQVLEKKDSLEVFFEHREFRSPYHSMHYAGLLLEGQVQKTIVWRPLYHNKPVGGYLQDFYSFVKLDKEARQFFKQNNKPWNGYRIQLRLFPNFAARFGYYEQPFQTRLDLILDTRLYLAPGLSLQTGIKFPVQNSLDENNAVVLAPTMLHYFMQPVNKHFVALSLGTFYYDRYGLDIQYRYAPLEQRWSFGLEAGLTGYYQVYSDHYSSSDLSIVHAVVDAEYRLPFENLSLKLSAGRFIFEDNGARLDIIKQYGNVDIGLYAARTTSGSTIGFQFALPISPGSIYRTKKLELRTPAEFRWEYSYNNEQPVARKYRLGMPRLADMLRQYNGNFIKNLSR